MSGNLQSLSPFDRQTDTSFLRLSKLFKVENMHPTNEDFLAAIAVGEIVNLISVDSQKLEDACMMINIMWSAPLQVGLAIYFLYQTIGAAVFVGKNL